MALPSTSYFIVIVYELHPSCQLMRLVFKIRPRKNSA
jgi:hypothetical protein